jgi:hypothetical protein
MITGQNSQIPGYFELLRVETGQAIAEKSGQNLAEINRPVERTSIGRLISLLSCLPSI